MGNRTIWRVFIAGLILAWAAVAIVTAANASQDQEKQAHEPSKTEWELLFPEGEGKSYVLALCQQCHSLKNAALQRHDEPAWRGVILSMGSRGANFDEEEVAIMAKYLAEHFGPRQPPLELPCDLNKASPDELKLFPQLTPEEADQIVDLRTKKPFKKLADLQQVLSDEKIATLKPFVSLQ